ncbi:FtsW/RodA/SpoVE family cell cycle protein [Oceanobacillus luteolus]|uniref:FtsW/RodA/SpoVE family cell cycle protein n=1 Tax=Oceanobacillus luteolus TaxID=1274358 RepID=A0ABW4HSF3_9BACI|nr:FtsW/RodA/SpoVE family cell cycle protein [Oceanobacillus luteolus]MCM3742369.1 FtsW/RodA/SpoVE family cell cycle protein [Oceanobacillus luteolus]
MQKKQSYYVQSDLLILIVLFIVASLLAIYNAQQLEQYDGENFVLKQIAWFAVGGLFIASVQFLDMEQLYKGSVYIYIGGILLLLLLYISPESIARSVNGAKSWFNPRWAPVSLQPAEFVKLSTILYLSVVISKHKEKFEQSNLKSDTLLLIKLVATTALPVFLILLQPDFGTAMVYIFILGMMIIFSGISWKIILSLVAAVSALLGSLLAFIVNFPELAKLVVGPARHYQIDRILTWFDPTQSSDTANWHFDRAYMALGSGQLFGKGMSGVEVYYPEAQTDFIFSVIGETFGFIGGALVILLYFLLLYKLVSLGLSIYKFVPFASYYCLGFLSLILVHVFQNIGMTIGIMPVTGIPLPLISYGGSSVMATMLGLGVIYRISVEYTIQNDYLFK